MRVSPESFSRDDNNKKQIYKSIRVLGPGGRIRHRNGNGDFPDPAHTCYTLNRPILFSKNRTHSNSVHSNSIDPVKFFLQFLEFPIQTMRKTSLNSEPIRLSSFVTFWFLFALAFRLRQIRTFRPMENAYKYYFIIKRRAYSLHLNLYNY